MAADSMLMKPERERGGYRKGVRKKLAKSTLPKKGGGREPEDPKDFWEEKKSGGGGGVGERARGWTGLRGVAFNRRSGGGHFKMGGWGRGSNFFGKRKAVAGARGEPNSYR